MKYFLLKNKLLSGLYKYIAKVTQLETVTYDELVRRTTRRGITVTDTELKAAVDELLYTIVDELNKGKAVETPFVRYRPSIGGTFKDKDDIYDANRHTVRVNCSIGRGIKVDTANIPLEKVKHSVAGPYIEHILDYSTLDQDSVLTRGGTAELSGEQLKIDTTDPEQGLYFTQKGASVKVGVIVRNLPSELIFNIPSGLSGGGCQLEIRNRNGKNDKTVKSYVFPKSIIIK